MLRIIDTKWREHLYEMDYLQEGINLRAMGQRDPLTEWQREGYEMFGQMMQAIAQDLVRYVMHVQVQVSEPAKVQVAAAAEAAKRREALAKAPKIAPEWGDGAPRRRSSWRPRSTGGRGGGRGRRPEVEAEVPRSPRSPRKRRPPTSRPRRSTQRR